VPKHAETHSDTRELVDDSKWRFLNFEQLRPGAHLMGDSFEHANLLGRIFIYTSSILNVDSGERLVETMNTVYRLGTVDKGYKVWGFETGNSIYDEHKSAA